MASMSVKKVLIVEDSTSLNTLYQQYLRNEKVEILTAGNGAETKYLVANHEPSLVLLDLGLPEPQKARFSLRECAFSKNHTFRKEI